MQEQSNLPTGCVDKVISCTCPSSTIKLNKHPQAPPKHTCGQEMLYPQTPPKLLRQVISQPSNQNTVIVLYQITIESRKFKGGKSFKNSFFKTESFFSLYWIGGKIFFLKRWYLALKTVKKKRNSYPLIIGKLLLLFRRTIYQDF